MTGAILQVMTTRLRLEDTYPFAMASRPLTLTFDVAALCSSRRLHSRYFSTCDDRPALRSPSSTLSTSSPTSFSSTSITATLILIAMASLNDYAVNGDLGLNIVLSGRVSSSTWSRDHDKLPVSSSSLLLGPVLTIAMVYLPSTLSTFAVDLTFGIVFKLSFLTCYVKAASLDCPINDCVVVFSLVFRRRLQPCFRCHLTPVFVLVDVKGHHYSVVGPCCVLSTAALLTVTSSSPSAVSHRRCHDLDSLLAHHLGQHSSVTFLPVIVFAFAGAEFRLSMICLLRIVSNWCLHFEFVTVVGSRMRSELMAVFLKSDAMILQEISEQVTWADWTVSPRRGLENREKARARRYLIDMANFGF
ncbi:hypothetical protein BDZ89DRAFT_1148388 [Hymenopellis radicata]|nr:hypothetical protein BDZ89DRAFT_1148388 [Hymenopellis radicata]